MISIKLLIYLSIGTLAMLVPIIILGAWYKITLQKRVVSAVLLTIAGTIGTYILFFIENGWIGGTSFFGAIFFVPVLFLPVAKLIKVPHGVLMDICAPAECIMLVIMKLQCFLNGCCEGRTVCFAGNEFIFPSQIAEMMNAFLIFAILMFISYRKKQVEKIYPLFMIIYGFSRFILNIFRESWITTEMFLPFGNIWSLVSILAGTLCIVMIRKKRRKEMVIRTK